MSPVVPWPEELVAALGERRGVLFLGSGLSAAGRAPGSPELPTWEGLLSSLADEIQSPTDAGFASEAINSGRYLDAAQIISDCVSPVARSTRLQTIFGNPRLEPGEIYEQINLIDQPVVMTTNYDRLYEKYWERFGSRGVLPLAVRKYDDIDVASQVRQARSRVYLKLHGCISHPSGVILSRSEYNKARYCYSRYFEVVSALVLTRSVVFLGCGFNGDPDIDLILEDAAFAAQSELPHYALLRQGMHDSLKKSLMSVANIQVLEYPPDDVGGHENAKIAIHELATSVVEYRDMHQG